MEVDDIDNDDGDDDQEDDSGDKKIIKRDGDWGEEADHTDYNIDNFFFQNNDDMETDHNDDGDTFNRSKSRSKKML